MRDTIKMLGLVIVLALSACGGGQGDNSAGLSVAAGDVGNGQRGFPGLRASTVPVSGNLVWGSGVTSDLISTEPNGACAMMADVNGATASGVPGQSCTGPDGIGGLSTVTFDGYTFMISADGQTATENMWGT